MAKKKKRSRRTIRTGVSAGSRMHVVSDPFAERYPTYIKTAPDFERKNQHFTKRYALKP